MSLTMLNLDDTLGAAFIGYTVSCIIFGVFTMQSISYFVNYRADSWSLKMLVGFTWCTELSHQSLLSHALYHYSISLFGSPLALITEPLIWSLVTQLLVGAVSGNVVKTWLVVRVWKFSNHNIIVTAVLAVAIVGQIGSIIALTIEAFKVKNILDLAKIKVVASFALAMFAVTDVLVAVALCYYLRKWRTGYREPDSFLNRLVQYAFSTGAVTSTLSILTLILYDARPSTFQYMAVYFVLAKMFAVSLMCALSTRKQVSGQVIDEFLETNGAIRSVLSSMSMADLIAPSHPAEPMTPYTLQSPTKRLEVKVQGARNFSDVTPMPGRSKKL